MSPPSTAIRSLVPKIPSPAVWTKKFRVKSTVSKPPRCTIADTKLAESAFEELQKQTNWTSKEKKNMTVIEINPGLGVWTSALFNGGFKKIYTLEPAHPYFEHVKELADASKGAIIPLKKDGYKWETYVELKGKEYLGDVIDTNWEYVHPNIFFTGTLPKSSKGEQLLAQFATCIVNKMALHSMGRIQMALWIPDVLLNKFISPPKDPNRCKMGVVTEACADVKVLCSTNLNSVYPQNLYHLVHIVPIEKPKITADWDVFEYVIKHIFVMQKQPLNKMVRTLGPGADIILKRLSFDPSIPVGEMTVEQINEVAIKFDQWPLRPRVLFEDAEAIV
ncbi:unnamed protein product [Cunninghamella blakesleeana]